MTFCEVKHGRVPVRHELNMPFDLLRSKAFLLALILVFTPIAFALPIPGLFNTGMDEFGNLLPDGALDPHYTFGFPLPNAGQNARVIAEPLHPSWMPNNDTSRWLWIGEDAHPNGNGVNDPLMAQFELYFDLTGFDPRTAVLRGRWVADDAGVQIYINGHPTGIDATGFDYFTEFTIISASMPGVFLPGLNVIEFRTTDNGAVAGFRAEISGEASMPEPVTMISVAGGLAVLFAARRFRSRRYTTG